MTTHLVTVGTSLLGNARRHLGRAHTAPVSHNELVAFLAEAPPARASAETNSLHRTLAEGDRLLFFPSDTEDGRVCAEALAHHFRHTGYDTPAPEPIPGLTYDAGSFAADGLLGLAALLVSHTDSVRHEGGTVRICATGGFKAEAALATLVGLVFGAEVYYIHEMFNDLVTLPPLPVSWNFALAHDHRDVLEWLLEDVRTEEEVEERLRGRPPELRALIAPTKGGLGLSAVGFVLLAAEDDRQAALPAPDLRLSTRARKVYDEHHGSRAAFERLLQRLGDPVLRDSQSERLPGAGGYIYPRGTVGERIAYDLDGLTVFVCELLPQHQRGTVWWERYHEIRSRGIDRHGYDGFAAWTPPPATPETSDPGEAANAAPAPAAAPHRVASPRPIEPARQRPGPAPRSLPGPKGSGRTLAELLSEDILRRLRGGTP